MSMGDFLNPINVLKDWGDRLMSPLGFIFLAIAGIYIFLRVTGRIEGIKIGKFGRKGNTGSSQKPNYILK